MSKLVILIGLFWIYFLQPLSAHSQVFPLSTEMQIGKMKNLIDKAPAGLFLTVGGERAFRGGAMFEKIQHLMIVDRSSEIIKFNRINIQLLKAPHKEDYKYLRWEAPWMKWQYLSSQLTQEDFEWWNTHVRNIQKYPIPEELNRYGESSYHKKYLRVFRRLMRFYTKIANKFNKSTKAYLRNISWNDLEPLHFQNEEARLFKTDFEWFDKERQDSKSCMNTLIEDPSQGVELGQVVDYKSGNYLFDDKMYDRLHNMVLEDKITTMQLDLSNAEDIDQVRSCIQKLNLNLAILDGDNLFAYEYMGEEKFRAAVSQFTSLGTNESILVLMHNYKRYACAQFSIYMGFTFENFRTWSQDIFFYPWIHNLPSEAYPVIDGRLYEKDEQLPLSLGKE